jgi:beta-lactamase regulating signal transducer with metallopeptidase domain
MNPDVLDHALSFALSITLKASVLLGIAGIIQAVTHRRTSAAMRHLVWTLAIASVLVLPVASLALPAWAVTVGAIREPPLRETPAATLDDRAPAAAMVPERSEGRPVARSEDNSKWWIAIACVYATGVLVMLVQFAFDRRNLKRLAREGTEMRDREWTRLLGECAARLRVRRPVRLLRSRERAMPMAFGTRHPTIVVPAIADTWVEDRRRAVVLHELAHVARFDCFTQTLAFAACAMYWFHPAAWWAARRLRVERELACDDRVIATAGRAREYADHLLEIAYAFGGDRAPALAVSMARPRQLEGRMLAALDAARNRSVPAWPVRLAGAVIAATLLLPVASATSAVVTADPEETLTQGAASLPSGGRHEGHRGASASAAAASQSGLPSVWPARNSPSIGDVAAQDAQDGGTWEIRPGATGGTVHLRLTERDSSSGTDVGVDQLTGLTASQLAGAGGPVQFRLQRDAGTFSFDGVLRNGLGAGTFSFTADPQFPAELVKRGFARPTQVEQYQMARHDVGYAFLDELNAQGYAKPETSELVRAGQHGVQAAYVRDLGGLGYRLGTLAPLIELRDHGVTPAYIRELAELGYKGLPVDDLRTARDHGVTPEFVKGMREAGYGSLTMPQLINARDHGVSAAFASELAAAGYAKLPLDALIRTRDHGVSAEYAREMRALGHTVTLEELVSGRDHGVSVEFAREMGALGFGNLSLEKLVRLRDHGVTPKYAQELKALGYDRIAIEDLVTLRDHGVSTENIRAANARAGTRLPLDMLKSLAAGGMR